MKLCVAAPFFAGRVKQLAALAAERAVQAAVSVRAAPSFRSLIEVETESIVGAEFWRHWAARPSVLR